MPKHAVKGGDVTLLCEHSVLPEQLYKVVWRKGNNKIFQYIKGRKPPFISYPITGAVLNVSIFITFTFTYFGILDYKTF